MTRAVGLANASMLAPLLGVTDTLPKALSFLALSALIVTLYGLAKIGRASCRERVS